MSVFISKYVELAKQDLKSIDSLNYSPFSKTMTRRAWALTRTQPRYAI